MQVHGDTLIDFEPSSSAIIHNFEATSYIQHKLITATIRKTLVFLKHSCGTHPHFKNSTPTIKKLKLHVLFKKQQCTCKSEVQSTNTFLN